MVHKNKNIINIENIIAAVGTTAMMAATVCTVADHIHREGTHLAALLHPVSHSQHHGAELHANDQEMRRSGREEIHHGSATYGSARRSMPVSGTV